MARSGASAGEYRGGGGPPDSSQRHAVATRAASASAEYSSARARPATRGSALARCGASAARHVSRSHSAHSVPAIPRSASACTPVGRASTGTSHASASTHARPNVSQSLGQMTALAAFIHSGTSSVGDVAERQQLGAVAAPRARARGRRA